jgi:hypothetical protein
VLSIYNIYHYFKVYKVFWDLRVTQKQDYFPDKILDFLSHNVNSDSLVLVCNNPEFYYYTNKKGIDYLDHRVRKLLKKQGDRKGCFDILKKNKIRYIYTNWAFESIYRNRLISEILSLDCIKIFPQGSKSLYEVRKNIIENEFYSKDFIEYRVWYGRKKIACNTSPSLLKFFQQGEFEFDYNVGKKGKKNLLTIKNRSPDKDGRRKINFGYEANRKGFKIKISENQYMHLIVKVKISSNLMNRNNYIFISDFKESWESRKTFFSTPGWRTYFVSKKVRPESKRLILGFRFNPQSSEDKLMIRDVHIYLSEKPI